MKTRTALLVLFGMTIGSFAQAPTPERQQFIRLEAPVVLAHVRVIDGTGAAPRDDQTIVIIDGKIQSIGPSVDGTTVNVSPSVQTLDLRGYTVLPGLVGMHDHMFFPEGGTPPMYSDMGISFPRLYLALGVTTIRTAGSVVPFTDLEIKRLIDVGRMIGPKMHITAPYLEGRGAFTPVMHELTGPDDARRMVTWAARRFGICLRQKAGSMPTRQLSQRQPAATRSERRRRAGDDPRAGSQECRAYFNIAGLRSRQCTAGAKWNRRGKRAAEPQGPERDVC